MTDSDSRTPLSELLASMSADGDAVRVHIPDDWLQGRAVYGGLSAALCLQATLEGLGDDLPPLRSVQLSFIGPAGSDVRLSPEIVRQGKSTTFVTVDMSSDDKLAVRATLCFARARSSHLSIVDCPAPVVAGVADCADFFRDAEGRNQGPNFAQHFNSRFAGGALPASGAQDPSFTVWMQHKDSASRASLVGLVALADALPPAAMACFAERAPISTMTWMFDVLDDTPHTDDGWWLSRSVAESTADGYSSQAMTVWNSAGQPVIVGRQNVAIFY
ncbi:thioesterase family protein [Salinisphaera sp. T31B1]|uniref:thioesterase family protein n=1 Tax=Salinisphaera sp. T31B1 TaxID=727963 RepID=UPI0033416075